MHCADFYGAFYLYNETLDREWIYRFRFLRRQNPAAGRHQSHIHAAWLIDFFFYSPIYGHKNDKMNLGEIFYVETLKKQQIKESKL